MAKCTITVIRSADMQKPTGAASARIVEALIHIAGTNNTIHAEDLKLRRISGFWLQGLNSRAFAVGSIVNTKAENNYASMTLASLRSKGTVAMAAGTIQDFYAIVLGE